MTATSTMEADFVSCFEATSHGVWLKSFIIGLRVSWCMVYGYSDLDFACYVDSQKSTSGYIFIFADGVVSWRSAKETLTTTSTMEAEFLSCFEATSHDV